MSKDFENRHWEVEEFQSMLVGKLHFTEFYNDEIILGFQQDKDDPEVFWYVSNLLNVEQDCITADSPDEAMEEFESMIVNYIEDEISDLEEMKVKFLEERI